MTVKTGLVRRATEGHISSRCTDFIYVQGSYFCVAFFVVGVQISKLAAERKTAKHLSLTQLVTVYCHFILLLYCFILFILAKVSPVVLRLCHVVLGGGRSSDASSKRVQALARIVTRG